MRVRKEAKGRRRSRGEGEVEPKGEASVEENASSTVVVIGRTAEKVGRDNSSAVGSARAENGRSGGKKGKLPIGVKEEFKTVGGQKGEAEEEKEEGRRGSETEREGKSRQHRKEVADKRFESKAGKKNTKTKDNVSEIFFVCTRYI